MRIERHYSTEGRSPYDGVVFRTVARERGESSGEMPPLEVPAHWSASACETLDARCLVQHGIAVRLRPVAEADVPAWLWRHEPDEQALAKLAPARRLRGEASARDVFDRIAGGWTYQGWTGGYFDSEADARAFFDEIRALLCHQRIAPEIAAWRSTGVWWAYGIAAGTRAGCAIDPRTGALTAAGPQHLPLCGAFITGVAADATGESGPIDLWRREAALLAAGLGNGANISRIGEESAASLIDMLRLGDRAAALFHDSDHGEPPARTVVVDSDHPEAFAFAAWKDAQAQQAAARRTGSAIMQRHVAAIVAACRTERAAQLDPAHNPALRLAILAARQAAVPDPTIERTIALVRQGRAIRAEDVIGSPDECGAFDPSPARHGCHLLRAADDALESEAAGEPELCDAAPLLDAVAEGAWSSGGVGLLFSSAAEAWNTCAESGEIRAAGGDGDFLFLDDSVCTRAVLNIGNFLGAPGFDSAGFAHAARLTTIALDIAAPTVALPTPRLARRTWDFRALGLGITNLGGALMAQAIPYDSDAGRAFCAAATALMTGTAYATSAAMAEEMGAFPAFAANRETMLRVVADHRRAAEGASSGYRGTGWQPVALRAEDCPEPALAEAARAAWTDALDKGSRTGFRNAHLSLIGPADAESALLDAATRGIAPAASLVRYDRLPSAGFRKAPIPAVADALARLGYGETVTRAVLCHVAGRRTLAMAPGVNHEHLLRRGFTENALKLAEAALQDAPDIRFAFDRWTFGDRFCTEMLGFSAATLDDPGFDMLDALGFSDAAVEAANLWCCGADTLEGAPFIEPDHLAVFDCVRPLGERGRRALDVACQIRMMAAAQPFLSGAIGHTLSLPGDASVDDAREALLLAWRLGLKTIVLERDEPLCAGSFVETAMPAAAASAPIGERLRMIEGGRPPSPIEAPAAAPSVRKLGLRRVAAGSGDKASGKHGTDIREGATPSPDARTSRRRSSHTARGTASVPSSADAVVEQRQV